jgi:hypothetical protein
MIVSSNGVFTAKRGTRKGTGREGADSSSSLARQVSFPIHIRFPQMHLPGAG